MPTVVLQPSSSIASGNFNNNAGSGFDVTKINDSSNSTYVFNFTANQSFGVHMDDTSGLSGATFNNFVVTAVFQKHGGRGADGSFTVDIGDGSNAAFFGSVSDTTFVTTNATPTTISSSAIAFHGSITDTKVDDMRLVVVTTDNTQVRFFQLYVTVDYTAAPSGFGHEVNNVASASIAKVSGVATASIAKVIGVD
tara:strand:+ start:11157 stop:11741 length:585 start_codon:yes stop_codon:yes gene_type:complete